MQAIRFSITGNTLTGPADYMRERGDALIANLATSATFGAFLQHSPDVNTALCVYLHTDYAAWQGEKQLSRVFSSFN